MHAIKVGVFEARTHLADLLRRAEAGDEVVITRRGKPVARLIGFTETRTPQSAQRLLDQLRAFRGTTAPTTLADLLEARHDRHRS